MPLSIAILVRAGERLPANLTKDVATQEGAWETEVLCGGADTDREQASREARF